jgi:hypothetical protein
MVANFSTKSLVTERKGNVKESLIINRVLFANCDAISVTLYKIWTDRAILETIY